MVVSESSFGAYVCQRRPVAGAPARLAVLVTLAVVEVYVLGRLCTWVGNGFPALTCDFLQWQIALARSRAL